MSLRQFKRSVTRFLLVAYVTFLLGWLLIIWAPLMYYIENFHSSYWLSLLIPIMSFILIVVAFLMEDLSKVDPEMAMIFSARKLCQLTFLTG